MRTITIHRIAIFLILVVSISSATATDYYVSTTGDNSDSGNITHPWQNVSYAAQHAAPGDTINLFGETWYDEHVVFSNSSLVLTAHDGIPTLDGVDKTGRAFEINSKNNIAISGITIQNYQYGLYSDYGAHNSISDCVICYCGNNATSDHPIRAEYADYMTVDNCEIYWCPCGLWFGRVTYLQVMDNRVHDIWGGSAAHREAMTLQSDNHHCLINNNTILNTITPDDKGGNGLWIGTWDMDTVNTNITVSNNIVGDSGHNCIDVHGNAEDILIINNTLYNPRQRTGIYIHDGNTSNIRVINNTLDNCRGAGISLPDVDDGWIEGNKLTNCDYGISIFHDTYWGDTYTSNNHTVIDNTILSTNFGIFAKRSHNNMIENNSIDANSSYWVESYVTNTTIRNMASGSDYVVFYYGTDTDVTIDYPDGRMFTLTSADNTPYWHPNGSMLHYHNLSDGFTLTSHNVTLMPEYSCLFDVSVGYESTPGDDRTSITANSTTSTNPTWINATMQNASATYNVSIDGVYTEQVVSDADKIVRYQYTGSWSPHTFEFVWSSGSGAAPGACDVVWIASDIDIPVGETVFIPISIENATGIAGVSMSIGYNSSMIEIVGGAMGDFTWNYSLNCDDTANGTAAVYTLINAQNLTGNLTVGTINVTAVGSIGETSNLTISNVILCDDYGVYIVPDAIIDGVVVLSGTLPGDADSNGVVNTLDVLLIMQYLMYPDTTPIDEDAADVCGNVGVDIADATLILSHCTNPTMYPLGG